MSLLSTLSIAANALGAQQKALQTTGHNIANASTPGFSRQQVVFSTAPASLQGGMSFGTGVEIETVRAVVDRFLESQLVVLSGSLGFAEVEQRALELLEGLFPVGGEQGVARALGDLFAAFADLANNPAGRAERIALLGKAQGLGEALARSRAAVERVQKDLDEELVDSAARLNGLLAEIAFLNQKIAAAEVGGHRANDDRDRRQLLIQEVARLTGAVAHEDASGQVALTAGSLLLVAEERAATFDASTFDAGGLRILTFRRGETSFDATAMVTGGAIGALLRQRDSELPETLAGLDRLAKAVADEVNAQHALGFDLAGNAGGDFFVPIGALGGAAANLEVNPDLLADYRRVAAAKSADGAPGDNRNALALAALGERAFASLDDSTFQGFYTALLGAVGVKAEAANRSLEFQRALAEDAQARRDAISGVSLDEEAINLIRFQRAFEAASHLVRVTDEMLEALVGMLG